MLRKTYRNICAVRPGATVSLPHRSYPPILLWCGLQGVMAMAELAGEVSSRCRCTNDECPSLANSRGSTPANFLSLSKPHITVIIKSVGLAFTKIAHVVTANKKNGPALPWQSVLGSSCKLAVDSRPRVPGGQLQVLSRCSSAFTSSLLNFERVH